MIFVCYVFHAISARWSGTPFPPHSPDDRGTAVLEYSWNVMAHGDAREGKWRGNWRMEWVASTFHTTSQHGVSSITTADAHTSAAGSRLNWRPHDLNGLVRFSERRNLVSARVPSHFKRSLSPLPSTNRRGPRHTADWQIGECCSARSQAKMVWTKPWREVR